MANLVWTGPGKRRPCPPEEFRAINEEIYGPVVGKMGVPHADPPPKTRVLIAAPTCPEHAELTKACMMTWGKTPYADVKFYSAEDFNVPAEADFVHTDLLHGARRPGQNLTHRLKAMVTWAFNQGYTHVFKCDTDTYVWVQNLLKSGFYKVSYSGYVWTHQPEPFCSGGAGFWLDRTAMEVIARSNVDYTAIDDVWVGKVLAHAGIRAYMDYRYRPTLPGLIAPEFITVHYVKDPAMMYKLHERYA